MRPQIVISEERAFQILNSNAETEIKDGIKEEILSACRRLVNRVVHLYDIGMVPREDLFAYAQIGVLKAMEKFNPKRGCAFSTFAFWYVLCEVSRGAKLFWREIRLPFDVANKIRQLEKTNGHRGLNIVGQIKLDRLRISVMESSTRSLDAPLGKRDYAKYGILLEPEDEEAERERTLEDSKNIYLLDVLSGEKGIDAEKEYCAEEFLNLLSRAMRHLRSRDAKMICMIYGLNGNKPMSTGKIAKKLRMSRTNVRRIKKRALDHMMWCLTKSLHRGM
ncbi:MAG: sigma-70 family RNA polymerase sigma factor [Candidatus Pacebacteria bacterium]|nr:sigma-70 family RNA polymerase sigma factor [Candidatus Paceibacterota bacterium]